MIEVLTHVGGQDIVDIIGLVLHLTHNDWEEVHDIYDLN